MGWEEGGWDGRRVGGMGGGWVGWEEGGWDGRRVGGMGGGWVGWEEGGWDGRRVGGMGGGWVGWEEVGGMGRGWMGWEDKPPYRCFGEMFMEQWQQCQIMDPQLVPSRSAILLTVTSHVCRVGKMPSRKADQLTDSSGTVHGYRS